MPCSFKLDLQQIIMLNQTPQFDDCFEVQLPIKKINQIIFMSSSRLLILHSPNQYTFVQILNRNQASTIKAGKLPHFTQNVSRISDECVSFICQNQLHIFNLLEERSLHIYSIARSAIYSEQFHYQTYGRHDKIFLFYKASILKGTPINIYYEIHQLSLKEGFEKTKRIKCQHQQIRKIGYSCGQVFSYQLSGYQIELIFLQSGITHKIQSIFNLFLIEIKCYPDEILLHFTHDEMENEFSTYKVTKKKVAKMNRTSKNPQKHTVYSENKLRSLVFKNCYNHRRQDPCVGIFRVRICRQTKLLHLMQNGLEEEISNQFKQLILTFNKE